MQKGHITGTVSVKGTTLYRALAAHNPRLAISCRPKTIYLREPLKEGAALFRLGTVQKISRNVQSWSIEYLQITGQAVTLLSSITKEGEAHGSLDN